MIAHVLNVPGNWYFAVMRVNELGLAEYAKQFDFTGSYTLVLLIAPADLIKQLQDAKKIY